MAAKFKKGDTVLVQVGRDKGSVAQIISVDPKAGRIVLDGVNVRSVRKEKTRQARDHTRLEVALPIDISNVSHVLPGTSTPSRVRFEEREGKKVRILIKSGESIDV